MNAQFEDGFVRFDAARNRLGLHGESEHPGDAFSRGKLVTTVWMANALLGVFPLLLITQVPVPEGSVIVWPLVAVITVMSFFAIAVVEGSIELLNETQVVDHTTAEEPREELAALQERFVDGDLDDDELAAEVERVIDQ
jgi:uncharacterized membrane protein